MRVHLALATAAALGIAAQTAPSSALEGVITSIKPVHSLAAAVMQGVSTPGLIVRGAGSGHAYSLRPSDAAALEAASVVFWIGPDMETFLREPVSTLAAGARVVALQDAPGLTLLDQREGGPFEPHAHGHDDHGDDDGHAHDDDHDGHAHAHGHEDGHGHAHGAHDMHFWLDPANARAMVAAIEQTLSDADPANAAAYRANAEAYGGKLDALVAEVETIVAPVRSRPAIVFHDAYQYFERRFGINVVGSITVNPDTMPGAQRIAGIRARVEEAGAACVFAEPQFEPRLVSVVTEGTDARTGTLDPLGAEIADGPELYLELIRNLATSLADCLSKEG